MTKLQGVQISNAQPQDGQVMKYNASASQWQAQTSSMPWSGITSKPTLVSTWTNDAGYLTVVPAQTWASITGKPTIPTDDSQLANSAGYITAVPAQSWSSITGKPSTFAPSAHTHAWSDITSGVPTNVSTWTNDAGYLTSSSSLAWAKVTGAPAFLTSVTGSGAGLTAGTVPIAAHVAGSYASIITSGTYSINITGSAAAPTTGASLGASTVPVSALVMGDYSSRITSGSYSINISGTAAGLNVGGALNQVLVNNGTSWQPKDDTREFSYVIQDTANDLTTTTGSVATIMTNAQAHTGWTILALYCQSDNGSPTFNIAIAGTNLYSSAQTCTTTNTAFNSFANASVASAGRHQPQYDRRLDG